jgi:HlyD family secretion protein
MNNVHCRQTWSTDSRHPNANWRQAVNMAPINSAATNRFRSSLYGVAIAVAGVGLTSVSTGCGSKAPANVPAVDAKAAGTLEVSVIKPTRETITRLIEQPGYIEAYYETPIYSKIPGYALEPKVDRGYYVKEGDLLLQLDVPEMEADLKAKEARVKQATAEIKLAEEDLKAWAANVATAEAVVKEANAAVSEVEAGCRRWEAEWVRAKNLLTKNVFDEQTRDEALNQLQQSQALCVKAKAHVQSVDAALIESKAKQNKAAADVEASKAKELVCESDRDFAKAMLNYRNIPAPFDGVVTQRTVRKGDFLQSSSSGSNNTTAKPIFVVMRRDIMRVTVQVPETDAKFVQEGLPATVRFSALNDEEIHGNVTLISWAVDNHARTLIAEIHLKNSYVIRNGKKEDLLRAGNYANVTIAAQLPNVLTLPNEAVLSDEGGRPFCFIVENGKAIRTNLRVGVRTNRVTEILQKRERSSNGDGKGKLVDFTGNEEIIAKNASAIFDGQAVTPSMQNGSETSVQK